MGIPRSGIVTLTTDFGTADGYAGALRGSVLAAARGTMVVDVTHEVPAQAIGEAAFAVRTAAPSFPPGTVHLVVVDPGVGSSRRLLVVVDHGNQRILVAPDNGVLSYLLDDAAVFEARSIDLDAFAQASRTFHGRDVLGPVAGRIAAGAEPAGFGPPAGELVRLAPYREPVGKREGRVLRVDRFGNLVTTLHPVGDDAVVEVGGIRVRHRVGCYAELPVGEVGWCVGSLGLIEVAVRDGSATERLGARENAGVKLL
ncbi:MAG: SAM-dependent chlorinase/fluorinase [Deltaproteobacteria bacterium]|nr:SAM-dependent chlorinase/fluorinase [Deltaproteobacteria bacterium]